MLPTTVQTTWIPRPLEHCSFPDFDAIDKFCKCRDANDLRYIDETADSGLTQFTFDTEAAAAIATAYLGAGEAEPRPAALPWCEASPDSET
jgi:hypothetical protein